MAVFTHLEPADFERLLSLYDLGGYVDHRGIASGIENTNYFLTTERGEFVLTIFEKLRAEQLPFYLELMRHLADAQVPCARPMPSRSGALQVEAMGKPALIASRIAGRDVARPTPAQVACVGQALAQAHNAVASFAPQQPNLRGLSWWQETIPALVPRVAPEEAELLTAALAEQTAIAQTEAYARLPVGAVHADLFRDNVLFAQEDPPVLGGFIDFYFAGTDRLVFDLAVTANDWCLADDNTALCPEKTLALLSAYTSVRRPTADEMALWPQMLQAAALRFYVSRLDDWHRPRAAAMLTPKDPAHFGRMLQHRRAHPCSWPTTPAP